MDNNCKQERYNNARSSLVKMAGFALYRKSWQIRTPHLKKAKCRIFRSQWGFNWTRQNSGTFGQWGSSKQCSTQLIKPTQMAPMPKRSSLSGCTKDPAIKITKTLPLILPKSLTPCQSASLRVKWLGLRRFFSCRMTQTSLSMTGQT
jgi:hypothetical protein